MEKLQNKSKQLLQYLLGQTSAGSVYRTRVAKIYTLAIRLETNRLYL